MAEHAPFRQDDVFEPSGRVRAACLTEDTARVLAEALRFGRATRWDNLRSPHVFMGLMAVPDAGVIEWGRRLGADLEELLGHFQELFHRQQGESDALLVLHREFLSDKVVRVLRDAYRRRN